MGIEYLGEMKFYKWLANPDYSIVTNIYPTHLKYLKNTKNVFKEKIQIIKDNIGILNNGSPYLKDIKPVNNKIIKFGQGSNCFASNIKLNLKGTSFVLHLDNATFKVQIPLYGRQMVDNFMAALFAAITIGINPISKLKNLRKLSSLDHRMKIINKHGLTIIDDSYNSNPEALIKAIKVLDEFPKHFKKVLVVGDMLDLGRDEVNYHKNIGKYICKLNLYALVGVGNLSKYMINQVSKKSFITSHTNSIFDAKMFINSLPAKNLLILIKGSRGIGLDELVTRL
jgi:UDP-N-acetylmuramoyl-tripeptide--D-alanyl-D-alanine ligase